MARVNVRAIRTGLGYSLNQMARAVGVDRRTIMRWENDGVAPSPLALGQLKRFQNETAADGTVEIKRPRTTPMRHPYEPEDSGTP